ncbi:MAG TPA: hypothetical protein VNO21_16265, partial [Polyangiaceae bacterium]|nr:hypothetical protein [Polyangiaceae bacterium]
RLTESGATLSNGFEAEVRMNKVFLAMLCDDAYQHLFTDEQRDAIRRYLPPTISLNEANFASALARKDELVFKHNTRYGGASVFMGAEHPAEFLKQTLASPPSPPFLVERGGPGRGGAEGLEQWIAQQFVEPDVATLYSEEESTLAEYKFVLGLYFYNGETNGMLVRGSRISRVVNLSSGTGKIGWGVVVDAAERQALLARLESL